MIRRSDRLVHASTAFATPLRAAAAKSRAAEAMRGAESPWSARARELAQGAADAVTKEGLKGDRALQRGLKVLLTAPELRGARVSAMVGALDGPAHVSASHNLDLALNPASNSKLAAATFALGVLGPEHTFDTELKLDDQGKLYAVGGFDPSLTTADLVALARELKASGVDRVKGLVLDNSKLVGHRRPDHFDEFGDEDWAYLATPEVFSVDKNLVSIDVRPGARPGDPATITTDQRAFEMRGTVMTIGAGERFSVGCDEVDNGGILEVNDLNQPIINVTGTIAASYTKGRQLQMKSPDPQLSSWDSLRRALRSAGIEVQGGFRSGRAPASATTVASHASAPLKELLKDSIATSNAFDHEMYTLAAASTLAGGAPITLAGAMEKLNQVLGEQYRLDAFRMHNASGLGDANRLGADDMAQLLRHGAQRFPAMLEGLARPGGKGTLKTRMLGTPAEGRLFAKTGTLNDAVALSGYVLPRDRTGSRRVFSMVVNDYAELAGARAVLDAFGVFVSSAR